MAETKIKQLDPVKSYAFLQANPDAVLIDVRTTAEIKFIGYPTGSLHFPWLEFPEMKPLPAFIEAVEREIKAKERPLLLICRSGVRSMNAAKALSEVGFTNLINIAEGFEGDLNDNHHRNHKGGWRFHGLPWQQK